MTRQEAKSAGLARYVTGEPCPQGHNDARYTSNGRCVVCSLEWGRENKEAKRRLEKARREENPAAHAKRAREWRRKNPEAFKEITRRRLPAIAAWSADNPEKVVAARRKYRTSDHGRAVRLKEYRTRRDRMTWQVPAWADWTAISAFYDEAERLTAETGVLYVVDHVIPIQGEGVSGLHVHTNLQILTAVENSRKGNSYTQ